MTGRSRDLRALRGVGPNPAVVLGLNPNALASIRALASAGVPVVAVGPRPVGYRDLGWASVRTHLARRVLIEPSSWPESLPDTLLACASAWQGPGVLLPSGDDEIAVLVADRARLAGAYRIVLPSPDLVTTLADKVPFSRHAAERGVPTPATLAGLTSGELAREAGRLRYPCIIKPHQRDARWDSRFASRKALECEDAAALLSAYRMVGNGHGPLVVQEVIPGGDDRLVFSHVYVARDGRELAMWTCYKVRQHPIHFGSSTLVTTRWDPVAADLTRRLLDGTGFVGYAGVEFKVDPRDGSHRALEMSVGRTWYPHGAGPAAGVNIPLIWYRDALGESAPPPGRQADGVLWLDEYRDVEAALDYRRVGELDFRGWWRSLRGKRVYAHLAWNDPMPGLFLAARFVLGFGAALRRWAYGRVGRLRDSRSETVGGWVTRGAPAEGGPVAVFTRPGPDWLRFEEALDARGVPLVLQARAAWVSELRERVWLVGLRDEHGEPESGVAVTVGRSLALPGASILRASRFGHGLTPEALLTACTALGDLARRVRALRLHVDLYVPDAERRAAVLDALAASGFARTDRPRSYERTLLIDLRPGEEELFASFHKKCRRDVRAAEKRGFACRTVQDPSLAGRMSALVAEAMARTGGPRLDADWPRWIELQQKRPDLTRLVGVFRSGALGPEALVGFVLGLRHGDTVEYSVAASTRIPGDNTPLLYAPTWELIRWAKAAGATTFDFGGVTPGTAGSGDPVGGISDFKRSFGGSLVEVGGEVVLEPSRWRSALAASVSAAAGRLRRSG